MRENKDIIKFLFKTKEEDELFDFESPELKKIGQKIEITNKKNKDFINSQIHPKCKNKMNQLINEHTELMMYYDERENGLYYEDGFVDGVLMILECLFLK